MHDVRGDAVSQITPSVGLISSLEYPACTAYGAPRVISDDPRQTVRYQIICLHRRAYECTPAHLGRNS
jgi:hypothetical protein